MSCSSSVISPMHGIDTDHLMNALTRVIMRSCLSKGVIISKNCVNYLINLMAQHPDVADENGSTLLKNNINRFEELCIEKCNSTGPIETLQMQIYFNEEVLSRDELMRENREKIKKSFELIKKEFLRQMPQSSEDVEKAYHMLVTLMILGSGIGTSSNSSALKETAVPEMLTRDIKTMNETLHGLMEKIGFKIHFLSRAVENYFCGCKATLYRASSSNQDPSKSQYKRKASSNLEDATNQKKAVEMKDCLVAAYQFEFFIR
ncbi:hypothetical protein J437_LFUL010818 [Ladona fulva]|uniref:Uncharacterized protein n=1 Tax=Ladona fulva TaxID=123851 RepID=A0A8K0K975_LADFU|nr:hypothetical protein J437_LFUL010818 [Ladona fulva]